MSEESKVAKTPWDLPPFNGDKQRPQAGSDIERLNELASQNNAAAVNQIGQEMRDRYLTSKNLNPTIKPLPETTTKGAPVMGGWQFNGRQR